MAYQYRSMDVANCLWFALKIALVGLRDKLGSIQRFSSAILTQ
jgi:hypothetical protein